MVKMKFCRGFQWQKSSKMQLRLAIRRWLQRGKMQYFLFSRKLHRTHPPLRFESDQPEKTRLTEQPNKIFTFTNG